MARQQIARPGPEARLGLRLVLEADEVGVEVGERLDVVGLTAAEHETVAEIAAHVGERTTLARASSSSAGARDRARDMNPQNGSSSPDWRELDLGS